MPSIQKQRARAGDAPAAPRGSAARKRTAPDERPMAANGPHAPLVSDEAVREKTGRDWREWFALLDARGAAAMRHPEIALLATAEGAGPWWSQTVAVSYERARGLRERNQAVDGYQVGTTKTIGVPLARLYRAWTDGRTRRRWLPDATFAVRKATPERSMRITWSDGSTLDVLFTAKGAAKSQVAVDHRKLPDSAAVARMRAFWRERLTRLAAVLEE